MIQIKPLANLALPHPTTGSPLQIRRVTMSNCYCLGEVELDRGEPGLLTLPTAAELYVPQLWNLRTQEVFCARTDWWSSLSGDMTQPVVTDSRLEVIVNRPVKQAVLLNCLDHVYGHALGRLLNATLDFQRFGTRDLVVLVPNALRHLVPAEVAEIWVYHGSWSQARRPNPCIEQEFARLYAQVDTLWLSPAAMIMPERMDISQHGVTPATSSARTIVYSYREDETWGGSLLAQKRNLERLGAKLRLLPGIDELWVQGLGTQAQRSHWRNWQVDVVKKPDMATEQRFATRLSQTLICIGTQGSNLMLPSALAWSVIELLSKDKLNHLLGGAYVGKRDVHTQMEVLFRHRTLYGDFSCADITPDLVYAVAYSLVFDRHFLHAYYARDFMAVQEVVEQGTVTARHMRYWRPPPMTTWQRIRRYARRRLDRMIDAASVRVWRDG